MRRTLNALALLWALPAAGFTIDDNFHVFGPGPCPPFQPTRCVDARATLTEAPRWSATSFLGTGLHDGIQVAVAPGFGSAFATTAGEEGLYEAAVLDAFDAWATRDLTFDITLDGAASEGTGSGFEIDLFAVDGNHPSFSGNNFTGLASFDVGFSQARGLTNGQTLPGWVITGADILINTERFEFWYGVLVAAGVIAAEDRIARLTNLLIHEIGHTVGLDHASEFRFANFDDDGDPFSEVVVDPLDPLAGLVVSAQVDLGAIMTSGFSPIEGALVFTELQPDDRSGRNVLYPSLPEASPGALVATALAGLAGWGRITGGRRRSPRRGAGAP